MEYAEQLTCNFHHYLNVLCHSSHLHRASNVSWFLLRWNGHFSIQLGRNREWSKHFAYDNLMKIPAFWSQFRYLSHIKQKIITWRIINLLVNESLATYLRRKHILLFLFVSHFRRTIKLIWSRLEGVNQWKGVEVRCMLYFITDIQSCFLLKNPMYKGWVFWPTQRKIKF